MRYDAIIIGAGPAGASAALMLARAGRAVAIVEKSSFPRRKVCGEFISATSLPLLRELGVLDDFLARAGPEVRRVGLFAKDLALSAPMPQPSNAVSGWGRALGREHLDLLLLEAAARAGAQVWQPWKAAALHRDGSEAICTIVAGRMTRELRAHVAIAAHGSWESGMLPTQVADGHTSSDLLAFKAHFRDSDLPDDLMPLLAFPGGYGGMVCTDHGRVTLSCCIRRDELRRMRPNYSRAAEAVLAHIQRHCDGARHALRRASVERAWLSAGPIRPGIRNCHIGGIFLVGNCAGEAHPIVAEGISMAMQSAALLCRRILARQDKVETVRDMTEIGDDYATEWSRAFALRIRAAALFANTAMSPMAAGLMRPILKPFPAILSAGAWLSGKANQVLAGR